MLVKTAIKRIQGGNFKFSLEWNEVRKPIQYTNVGFRTVWTNIWNLPTGQVCFRIEFHEFYFF